MCALLSIMDFTLPPNLAMWPPEPQDGHVEYKSFLKSDIPYDKFHRIITQLKWRLSEGYIRYRKHIAVYVLGIYDNGSLSYCDAKTLSVSLGVMKKVCEYCELAMNSSVVYVNQSYIGIITITDRYPRPIIPSFDLIKIV